MHTYTCETCGTELKRWEAVLRGNAIDPEPTAWCRRDAVALGLLVLPMPAAIHEAPVEPVRPSLAGRFLDAIR